MIDLTTLPTPALIAHAEKWLEQLEYSNGVHWHLRTVAGDTSAGEVFRELIRRGKERRTGKYGNDVAHRQ